MPQILHLANGSTIRFYQERHQMPGRRLLIARYLHQLRKMRDAWRVSARERRKCVAYYSHPEDADAKAEGFQDGLMIIAAYLPGLASAQVSAWTIIFRINQLLDMTARSTDPQIIPYNTGLNAVAVWLEPVAKRLSGERPK